jgi:hypothetical protein
MSFSHGPNKAFLVPDLCGATERNGNNISADVKDLFFMHGLIFNRIILCKCNQATIKDQQIINQYRFLSNVQPFKYFYFHLDMMENLIFTLCRMIT